jgi:hypothetical protein
MDRKGKKWSKAELDIINAFCMEFSKNLTNSKKLNRKIVYESQSIKLLAYGMGRSQDAVIIEVYECLYDFGYNIKKSFRKYMTPEKRLERYKRAN